MSEVVNFVPDHSASLRDETLHIDERGCPFTIENIFKTIYALQRHKCCDFIRNVSGVFID